MFDENELMQPVICGEGITRRILCRGGNLMIVEVTFSQGAEGKLHSHSNEQMSYITRGSFHFDLDGASQLLKAGDSIYVPPSVPHFVKSINEGSIILDIFTPQREDFLPQAG